MDALASSDLASSNNVRRIDLDRVWLSIRKCFAARGFAGSSIDDLSRETDAHRPTLYRAFGGKRDMFLKALDDEHEELRGRLAGIDLTLPLPGRLTLYLQAVTQPYTTANPDLLNGLAFGSALADSSTDCEVGARLESLNRTIEAAADNVLGAGREPGATTLLTSLALSLCVRSRFMQVSMLDANVRAIAAAVAAEPILSPEMTIYIASD